MHADFARGVSGEGQNEGAGALRRFRYAYALGLSRVGNREG